MTEYKEINGFPDYLIYTDGTIYSKRQKKFMKAKTCTGYPLIQLVKSADKKSNTIKVDKTFYIHRLIGQHFLENPDPVNKTCIDHIDRNPLNNDVKNLRWCSYSENCLNKPCTNKYGVKGVSFNNQENRFIVSFYIKKKRLYFGSYKLIEDAIEKAKSVVEKLHGEFFCQNNIIKN